MAPRAALKCRLTPFGTLPDLKFVVVCAVYEGKYLLSRHRQRDTWETQGGHIEENESPMQAAKRELFEESGITDADLIPVCDYCGYTDDGFANGAVFLAEVHALGPLPESEMQAVSLFSVLPGELTYPNVTPVLYAEALKLHRF